METHPLYDLMRKLEDSKVYFTLKPIPPHIVVISIASWDDHLDIDVYDDGQIKVARFKGTDAFTGDERLIGQYFIDNKI